MSIDASVATFEHEGRKINLIDTPGRAELRRRRGRGAARRRRRGRRGQRGDGGRGPHRAALAPRRRRGPGPARLRQHARPRARRLLRRPRLAEALLRRPRRRDRDPDRRRTGASAASIDLIDMKAFVNEGDGPRQRRAEVEIPEELRAQAEEYREKLMDEVAENSDELMERYLDGEEIDHEEIVGVLKQGVTEGRIFPVTCGVATRNLGTGRLLERAGRGPALAGDARRGGGHRRRRRGDRDRARRGRAAGRLRVQDPRRPLHGADQPLPRLPRDAALRLAGRQRRAATRRSGSASSASRSART